MSARLKSELGAARTRGVLALSGLAALGVAAFATIGAAAPSSPAQAQYAPRNTAAPTISGTAQEGQTLTANVGTWTGDQPIVFTFQWLRCNLSGSNCVAIPNATGQTHTVTSTDVDDTLRVQVTGRNSDGSSTATARQTARVVADAGPPGAIRLPNGETSIPVTSVSMPNRLVVDLVQFSPNPVRSRQSAVTVRVKVKDTRGFVVRDALVFIRSTPIVTRTPAEQQTGRDGWTTFTTQPETDFPLRNGYSVQFFARVRKAGENPLAGVSSRRLVQVGTAR